MRRILFILLCVFAVEARAQVGGDSDTTTRARQDSTLAAVAFGSVTGAYTAFLTNTNPIRDLDVLNQTDAAITCSYNASTDHFVVPAYSSYSPDLGEIEMHSGSTISCKRTSGAPTVGSVYISAGY